MVMRPPTFSTCRLTLSPDSEVAAAIEATLAACAGLLDWLDTTVPPSQSSDLISLNRLYYETARSRFALPSQMITLCFRDWTRRRKGEAIEGVALDSKLFSIRSVSTVSLATISGRCTIPYAVDGYLPGWKDNATARLIRTGAGHEIHVATDAAIAQKESRMATEGVVGRIARLIAGMAHDAIGQAEQSNPKALLEQAIREIDSAADEVRLDIGKATAERHRVKSRRDELTHEVEELDRSLAIAVKENRDDLAAAGIERQLDIEAQCGVLDALLKDIDDSLAQFNATLDAVRASRREAEARLADIRRTVAAAPAGAGAAGHAGTDVSAKLERAGAAVARVTGVPAGPMPDKAVDELRQLARDHAVKERLARLKAGK